MNKNTSHKQSFLAYLLFIVGLLAPAMANAQLSYSITDIGALISHTNQIEQSGATAINNAGEVTGYFSTSPGSQSHGFLYRNGTITTIGGVGSSAMDINDTGQVTGNFLSTINGNNEIHAFLYGNSVMTDLGAGNGFGINNAGQVTGIATGNAFLYSDGKMTDLNSLADTPPGWTLALGEDINDQGQIVARSQVSGNDGARAFLYSDGTVTDLGTPFGTNTGSLRINNLGQITGHFYGVDEFQTTYSHAFLYSDGVMTDLGTLGGTFSVGMGINNLGQIVGLVDDPNCNCGQFPFLYSNGVMKQLNSLIDPLSGWNLISAADINDSGQITGSGVINGQIHAFILTPVPEPESYVLMLMGVGLVGTMVRLKKRTKA